MDADTRAQLLLEVPGDVGASYFLYLRIREVLELMRTSKKLKRWAKSSLLMERVVGWERMPAILAFPPQASGATDVIGRLLRMCPNVKRLKNIPSRQWRLRAGWETPGAKLMKSMNAVRVVNGNDSSRETSLPNMGDFNHFRMTHDYYRSMKHNECHREGDDLDSIGDYDVDIDALTWLFEFNEDKMNSFGECEELESYHLPKLEALSVRAFGFPLKKIAAVAPNLVELGLFAFKVNTPTNPLWPHRMRAPTPLNMADFSQLSRFFPRLRSLATDYVPDPAKPFELPNLTTFIFQRVNDAFSRDPLPEDTLISMFSQLPPTLRHIETSGLTFSKIGFWSETWVSKVWSRFTELETVDTADVRTMYNFFWHLGHMFPSLKMLSPQSLPDTVHNEKHRTRPNGVIPMVRTRAPLLRSFSVCACMAKMWPDIVRDSREVKTLRIVGEPVCDFDPHNRKKPHVKPIISLSLHQTVGSTIRSLAFANMVITNEAVAELQHLRELQRLHFESVAWQNVSVFEDLGRRLRESCPRLEEVELGIDPTAGGDYVPGARDAVRLLGSIGRKLKLFVLFQFVWQKDTRQANAADEWLAYTPSGGGSGGGSESESAKPEPEPERERELKTWRDFAADFLERLSKLDPRCVPESHVVFGPGREHSARQVVNHDLWRCKANTAEELKFGLRRFDEYCWKKYYDDERSVCGWKNVGNALRIFSTPE